MQSFIRVAYLTQVLVVVVQWSNVKRQTIWLDEASDLADVFTCCVDFYNLVISQSSVLNWLGICQLMAFLS